MFYLKDLDIFFKDFASNAFVEDGRTFKILIDDVFEERSVFSEVNINSRSIIAQVQTDDIDILDIKVKDIISVDGKDYIIRNIERETTGISRFILQYVKVR